MAIQTLSGVPTVIEAGNNYNFQETFTDFPANSWSMQFIMAKPGQAPNVFNATTVNTVSFQVNVSNLTVPGHYSWSEYVTETASSQRTTAKTGVLQVIPNLSTTQTLSSAATMLAAVETAISQLVQGGFSSVSVNNVSYTRFDVNATLIPMRTRLQAEVFREQQAADAFRGIDTSGMIGTRFKCR